jgi:hypothetical protein
MRFHPYVNIHLAVNRSTQSDLIFSSCLFTCYILLRDPFWFVSSDICGDHCRQISDFVLAQIVHPRGIMLLYLFAAAASVMSSLWDIRQVRGLLSPKRQHLFKQLGAASRARTRNFEAARPLHERCVYEQDY